MLYLSVRNPRVYLDFSSSACAKIIPFFIARQLREISVYFNKYHLWFENNLTGHREQVRLLDYRHNNCYLCFTCLWGIPAFTWIFHPQPVQKPSQFSSPDNYGRSAFILTNITYKLKIVSQGLENKSEFWIIRITTAIYALLVCEESPRLPGFFILSQANVIPNSLGMIMKRSSHGRCFILITFVKCGK